MSRKNSKPPGAVMLFALRVFMLACVAFGIMGVRWIWGEWQWLQSPRLVEVSGVAKHFRHRTTKSFEDRWTFSLSGHDKRIAFFGTFVAPPDDTRVKARVLLRRDDNPLLGGIASPANDIAYGLWIGDQEVISAEGGLARAREVTIQFMWMGGIYLLLVLFATYVMFNIKPRKSDE